MASATSGKRPSKFQSGKLGQTLTDLEAALNDWDSLADAPAAQAAAVPEKAPAAKDIELRKKTKKLLDQLREQLAELAD